MGRPNKYDTHVAPRLSEIADWVRNGATDRDVAERLDIAMSTFYEYKLQYSDFSEVLKKTRDVVDGEVENALLRNALNGNITAQIFWLKKRRPTQWRDKPDDGKSADGANGDNQIVIERRIIDLSKDKDSNGN